MKTSQRLHGLDHLRAFAIVSVFFYHYGGGVFEHHPAWLETICQFGWSGVDLFFVLSGYLIGNSLLRRVAEKQPISICDFYLQRFFRIMPVYWMVLALYFTFPVLIERSHLPPLWRFLTFTQNFNLGPAEGLGFSQVWSLCVEEHFYLIFPMLLVPFSSWRWGKHAFWMAGLLLIGSCALRAYFWTTVQAGGAGWYSTIYYPTYSHLDGLIIGVSIASIFTFYPALRDWLKEHSYWLLVLGFSTLWLAAIICTDQTSMGSSVVGFSLVALGFGCVVIAALSPRCVLYRVDSSITRAIALASYAIYLIHKIVIHAVQGSADWLNVDVDGTPMLLLCGLATLVVAWAFHVAIERPFMRLRDRIFVHRNSISNPVRKVLTDG